MKNLGGDLIDTTVFLNLAPKTLPIQNTIMTLAQKLDFDGTCLVSVSGGSDSDILIDLVEKTPKTCKIVYVFFDTGIEYQATKDHLCFLEQKYGIHIIRRKAVVPVPLGVKKYGVPFLAKHTSEMISRLQRHAFDFSSQHIFEKDLSLYPKCQSALRWWHNQWGGKGRFNISAIKDLKEYMQITPPPSISSKCCNGAKKQTAIIADQEFKPDLKIIGIRRSEGGGKIYSLQKLFHPCLKERHS